MRAECVANREGSSGGCSGDRGPEHPNALTKDTAKDRASGSGKHLRITIVSTWGSAIVSHGGQRVATPVKFNSDASVGLSPSAKNSTSPKLTRDEAIDLWNSWSEKGLD